jgi:ABC-type transport system substrate-binding protein
LSRSRPAARYGISGVEAVDADTVRFTAATANPIPWEDLGPPLAIMSKAWAKRHGAELPSQLGDERWDYAETHANGTGLFMLEQLEPGERMVLVRNPNWWGLAQHPHNIERIVQTRVNGPARGAELLLAGEIDVLQSPPADQLERIAATPGLKVQKAETNQTLYLGFDQASPELRSSNVKGRNPFADLRVRQAFYQGIDIRRIVEALHGFAVPAGMLTWPKGNGVAWHPTHCRQHPLIKRRLAKLIAGQVDVDPDHLDHVPAQDGEVLFLHRQLPLWNWCAASVMSVDARVACPDLPPRHENRPRRRRDG